MLTNHVVFSIPGINDRMLNKYQVGASFQKTYNNMKGLADYRKSQNLAEPFIEWKYLLFNWNDHKWTINKAITLAEKAGLDVISFWPTISPFYGISWRYYLSKFYRNLGEQSWIGKEVNLRIKDKKNE